MDSPYNASISEFLLDDPDRVVGVLANAVARTGIATQRSRQIEVWGQEVELLKRACTKILAHNPGAKYWHIVLEYDIPRRQKRPDVIILAQSIIYVIELKIGATSYDMADVWQARDYALNLRDFHAESNGCWIVPILCSTQAKASTFVPAALHNGLVRPVEAIPKP